MVEIQLLLIKKSRGQKRNPSVIVKSGSDELEDVQALQAIKRQIVDREGIYLGCLINNFL